MRLNTLTPQMRASAPRLIREKLHTESLMKWFLAQQTILKCLVNYWVGINLGQEQESRANNSRWFSLSCRFEIKAMGKKWSVDYVCG